MDMSNIKKIFFVIIQFLFILNLNAQVVKYTTDYAFLYSRASFESTIIDQLPSGTMITVSRSNMDSQWIPLIINNKIGYINSKSLKETKSNGNNGKPSLQRRGSPNYYTNSEGIKVQSPTYYNSPPKGATAQCRDGTYSFSRSRRGTCSGHGGVAKWL